MIGLFDSGSGGLTILDALHRTMPSQDFLYLGDHARAPYGHRSNAEILDYTREGVNSLFDAGAQLVLLACNTAAAIALRTLQQNWLEEAWPGRRILGVLVPTVEAVTGMPWSQEAPTAEAKPPRNIVLFATLKTVESNAFTDEVKKRAPHVNLIPKACPGLVDAIEGNAGALPIAGLVAGYVEEVLDHEPHLDAALLGCTHFPLVESAFRRALPSRTKLFSQPEIVARATADYLARHLKFDTGGTGQITCWTSGDPISHKHISGLEADIRFTKLPTQLDRAEVLPL